MIHPDPDIATLLRGLASPRLAAIDLGLSRVERLLDALGNPHRRVPPVIHVAGTNGKGSLVAYLTAIFQAANYKVHRYISPSLVRYNERIMLADHEISDSRLRELLQRVLPVLKDHPVTEFEASTAMAFLAFAETPADVLLLETGLGGRLDATNVIAKPLLTAITPIAMDHKEFLGDTLEQIAAEKAGILKLGVDCVLGPQLPGASMTIERIANNKEVVLYSTPKDWRYTKTQTGFRYSFLHGEIELPKPALEGEHQIANAATAIACIEKVAGISSSFNIAVEHIKSALTKAFWPARLQRLDRGLLAQLLPEGCELWLDGGHNPAAGEVIAEWIKSQTKPVHVLCAMVKNKDVKGFLAPLALVAQSLTALSDQQAEQFQPAATIKSVAEQLGLKTLPSNDVSAAIQLLVKEQKKPINILICGSLYLAGNILWQNSR